MNIHEARHSVVTTSQAINELKKHGWESCDEVDHPEVENARMIVCGGEVVAETCGDIHPVYERQQMSDGHYYGNDIINWLGY